MINILNSKNKIKIGKNSELHCLEFVVNDSKETFLIIFMKILL